MKHITIAAIVMTVGAGALSGCSSGSGPSSSVSSSVTSLSTSAGPAVASPAPTGSTRPTQAAPVTGSSATGTKTRPPLPSRTVRTTGSAGSHRTGCVEAQLRATIDPRAVPGNGTKDVHGATRKGVLVDFQNTSNTTCTLTGYPGAAALDSAGTQVTQATRSLRGELGGLPAGANEIPTVSVAPGRYAAAMIEGVDRQHYGSAQAGCSEKRPRILITPPNTRIAVPFDVSWPACFNFDVHPVMILPDAP